MPENQENVKQILLGQMGEFHWDFGKHFFIGTQIGNFVWSSPEYGGDNKMRVYKGSFVNWVRSSCTSYCRYKGMHNIGRRCGDQFVIE